VTRRYHLRSDFFFGRQSSEAKATHVHRGSHGRQDSLATRFPVAGVNQAGGVRVWLIMAASGRLLSPITRRATRPCARMLTAASTLPLLVCLLFLSSSIGAAWAERSSVPAGTTTIFVGAEIGAPYSITTADDGSLWFTDSLSGAIRSITPTGAVTSYDDPRIAPVMITAGPDGALWFTNRFPASIGRITTEGVVSVIVDPLIGSPSGIVPGPDGALWFTNTGNNSIGRVTVDGTVSAFTGSGIDQPVAIAAGPDGNVWFTNYAQSVGRITTTGEVAVFSDPTIALPQRITAGPDGAMWFTNWGGNSISRITTSGQISTFTNADLSNPGDLAVGADGAIWFTNTAWGWGPHPPPSIGRITTEGVISKFTYDGILTPAGITSGLDGALWFADTTAGSIGRIEALGPPSAPLAVEAVASLQSATVTWSPPAADGESPVTGYTVTASPSGQVCVWDSGPLTCRFDSLVAGTSYTFTVSAMNNAGVGTDSEPSNAVIPWSGAAFHPVAPARILDSRNGTGGWPGALTAGTAADLIVAGRGGVPSSAIAVVLNVTVTEPSADAYLTVWPTGTAKPFVSNLNFTARQTIPNLVTVGLGDAGAASFASSLGTLDVVVDVAGYYDNGVGDLFNTVIPTRILDSRDPSDAWTGPLTNATERNLTVAGVAGVPATATAVVANVTVTNPTHDSFVTVWPAGLGRPNVSNLNFTAHQTIPNLVTVHIGAAGQISFGLGYGATDVIVDVVGYFDPGAGDRFHPIEPTRILDDRENIGLSGPWGTDTTRTVRVAGVGPIPQDATVLVANLTATGATAESFVTGFATGTDRPNVSNLNFRDKPPIPNLVVLAIGEGGAVNLYNLNGSVDLIADAAGYYAGS